MAAAATAGAGAATGGGGGDGGEDGGGDGGGGRGGGGGGGGGSLRQHARREAVSMCTTGEGGCAQRVCRRASAHLYRREEVVDDGLKRRLKGELDPIDL